MADTTNREAVMAAESKPMPMSERVRVVAIIGTVLAPLSYIILMPFGWTLAGIVIALVAWPTWAIVRTMEGRPPAGSKDD